jgi:hypothetical protein
MFAVMKTFVTVISASTKRNDFILLPGMAGDNTSYIK